MNTDLRVAGWSHALTLAPERLAVAVRRIVACDCAVAAERFATGLEGLTPAEAVTVKRAAAKRQGEFAAGRIAARRALAEIGRPGAEIVAGIDRAPQWPVGTIGSISHTGNLAVAVVAATTSTEALGIDIEIDGAVHSELWPAVFSVNECQWLQSWSIGEQSRWATVMFSAKEAFYKFQYPMTGQWIDFADVEVRPDAESFAVRVLHPPLQMLDGVFSGRWLQFDGLIVTALHRRLSVATLTFGL